MVYRPNIDERLCFVLMPFRPQFDGYYEHIIKPAVKLSGMDPLRADEIYGTRAIIRDIWETLWRARIIVADATGRNPNVNYELGLAHALGIATIIITKELDDVPFDYRHRRCIEYKTEQAGWEEKLKSDLGKSISATLTKSTEDHDLPWPYDTNLLNRPDMMISLESPRQIVLRGIARAERLVAGAYGPRGTNVSVSLPIQGVVSQRQGLVIVNGTRSANPIEEYGIDVLRNVARHLQDRVGDGTKTAMLLTQAIIEGGQVAISQGHPAKELLNGMERAIHTAVASITSASQSVKDDHLVSVALTASGDRNISTMIIDAIRRAGKDGIVTVETGPGRENMLTVEEGLHFDHGYLSDTFVTNPNTSECVLENCRILLWHRKIVSMRELLPLLESIAQSNEPLLVVADDIEGEALSTIVVNNVRGSLKCVAVRSPFSGDRRTAMLQDIAVLTGARLANEHLGVSLENMSIEALGTAEKVVVTKDRTTILPGRGPTPAVKEHIIALRAAVDRTSHPFERAKLQERLARLVGGIATVVIGGATSIDSEDQKYRATSALSSAFAAIEGGWTYGGGTALLNAKASLTSVSVDSDIEQAGVSIIASALERPFAVLVQNSGESPVSMLANRQAISVGNPSVGFNAETLRLEDVEVVGILDPTITVRTAIEVAFSFAKMVLKTETWDL